MPKLEKITGILPSIRTYKPSDDFACPDTLVGIEIELESIRRPSFNEIKELWEVTPDGSLRNNGKEFVSVPIFGEDINIALSLIDPFICSKQYTISSRCGIHVHMNASDLSTEDLISISCWYALVEKLIFRCIVGEERSRNIYCLPIQSTDILYEFYSTIKEGVEASVLRAIESTYKYSAFNILPLTRLGTIEFRHAQTIGSTAWIKSWIQFILQLKKLSLKYPILDYINEPKEILHSIIFDNLSALYSYDGVDKDLLSGFITAKDMLNFTQLDTWWEANKEIYEVE